MENKFDSELLVDNAVGPKVDPTCWWRSPKRYSATLCLLYPEPPVGGKAVVVRRGDLITLALNFLYKEPSTHISVRYAEMPLSTDGELPKSENGMSLDMVLWDITRGHSAYPSTFCYPCCDPSSISEAGTGGCFVRFRHGRHSPIKDGNVKICFDFPKIINGNMEQRKYRIRVILHQSGPFPYIRGPYELYHTISVLPSTQQLLAGVTPPIPAHVWRLLSAHTLTEAISAPGCPSGPFDTTLASGLGLDRHCLPLLSALTSYKYREMTYRLSITKRQYILDTFLQDFENHRTSVKRELECLEKQYNIARLITSLQSPISYLPFELLADIFTIAVEQLGVSPATLQRVCPPWRALAARLWGTLHMGTWTEIQPIKAILERNPSSMTVVVDTKIDEALSVSSQEPYAALALAWTSAPRWRSLTINSFPSDAFILASNNTALAPRVPLENLESLSVGIGCDSSQYIKELIEAIASTNPKLTSLTLAATSVLQHIGQSQLVHIYSRLTVLEVEIIKFREPVDLLRHCASLEILKLSGVVSHHLFPEEELPFLQTLRQLWLQRASIQWMVGRTFSRLQSCRLLNPVDSHIIDRGSVINLPVCSSIVLRSHAVRTLAIFDAPVVRKIKVECNQWSKARGNLELGRIWSRKMGHGMLQPRILSLTILCGDKPLLEAIQQMVLLRELNLDLPHPSALGVTFFETMRAVPTNAFTGRTRDEWTRWTEGTTEWQTRICPSLVKLQLRYKRWLRIGEIDIVTPLLVGVAWSWGKLPSQRQFNLELGKHNRLQLVEMEYNDPAFMHLWGPHVLRLASQEMLYIGSITSTINRFIGFTDAYSEFSFIYLEQYYSSFFRRLRAFYHHPASHTQCPYNVLPFFEHLEELRISNLHFEPCPPTTNLPLCRTLRRLHAYGTSLDWMDGRVFERLSECSIIMYDVERVHMPSGVVMPACREMEFDGPKYPNILASFRLPALDLLHLGLSRWNGSLVDPWSAQDILLLIQSIRPRVLQICMNYQGESLVPTLQSNIYMEGVVVKDCQICQVDMVEGDGGFPAQMSVPSSEGMMDVCESE